MTFKVKNSFEFIINSQKYICIFPFFWKSKLITLQIFKIQSNNSIMCSFYCAAIIKHMIAGKNLLDYTSLFSHNGNKKKDTIIIYKHFKGKYENTIIGITF